MDELLFRVSVTSEWCWPVDLSPFLLAQKASSLVDLGCQIQWNHVTIVQHDERVDLQIRKVEIFEELVERHHERGHVAMLACFELPQKTLHHHRFGQIRSKRNLQFLSLGVHITHVYATFVVEKDLVMGTERVKADVVFLLLLVRAERRHDEMRQRTHHCLHLLLLAHAIKNPLLALIKRLVDADETCLATSLNELIRLSDELPLREPWICLQNSVPRLSRRPVQHVRRNQCTSTWDGVLATRVLW
mmetsp:Transcript_5399/g.12365  ORF Transcript_5399/g.12365 Transcript_5399/m.12365 type:complete len:246 (+) Transcript_5399:2938-3675(+)